jgi:hypothetical protein
MIVSSKARGELGNPTATLAMANDVCRSETEVSPNV